METAKLEFNEVLTQHENIIYYLIRKFGVRDPEGEFYQEGLIALWTAVETYDDTRGKFSSYAYFRIEKTLLSMIRKSSRQLEKEAAFLTAVQAAPDQLTVTLETGFDPYLYEIVKQRLTANQMKWFTAYVLEGLSVKAIAEREQVSVEAVKGWRKEAKVKIKKCLAEEKYSMLL